MKHAQSSTVWPVVSFVVCKQSVGPDYRTTVLSSQSCKPFKVTLSRNNCIDSRTVGFLGNELGWVHHGGHTAGSSSLFVLTMPGGQALFEFLRLSTVMTSLTACMRSGMSRFVSSELARACLKFLIFEHCVKACSTGSCPRTSPFSLRLLNSAIC